MPRLPFDLAQADLPASSGIRGGGVGLPVAGEPGVDLGTASLPGRALAAFGDQHAQIGESLQQAEAYQMQRQRAQSVLDSTLSFQDSMVRYQEAIAARNQGDYRDLPKDVVQLGKDIFEQVALDRKLTPESKALFREKMGSAIVQAQHNALQLQTARRQQDLNFAFTTEVQQVQQDAMQARDEGELMVHLGRLQGTLLQHVHAGNIHGDVAAKLYHDTELSVREDRALRAVWNNPVAGFQELRDLSQGKPATIPEFQHLPAQMIDPLLGKAAARVREAVALKETEIRQTQAMVKQGQDKNEGDLFQAVYGLAPIPENRAKIQALGPQIQEAWQKGLLSKDGSEKLAQLVWAWDEKARTYTPTDDYAAKTYLERFLAIARTPQDFAAFREEVASRMNVLTSDTFHRFYKEADSQSSTLNPLNRPSFHKGRDLILAYGDIPTGMSAQAQMLANPEAAGKVMNALLAYTSSASKMLPEEMDRDAIPLAYDIIQRYMTGPELMTTDKRVSQPLKTGGPNGLVVPNREWAMYVLSQQLGLSEAEQGRQLRDYETWAKSENGQLELRGKYGNPETVPAPWFIGPLPYPAPVVEPPKPVPKPSFFERLKGTLQGMQGAAQQAPEVQRPAEPTVLPQGFGGRPAFAPVRK